MLAIMSAGNRDNTGVHYGEYRVEWERRDGDPTSIPTGPIVELSWACFRDLELLRGSNWPESLWHAVCAQYPAAFIRAFLRTEFQDPLSEDDAAELSRELGTGLDTEEFFRQINEFNVQMRQQQSRRGSHRVSTRTQEQVDGTGETMSLNAFVQSPELQETVVETDSEMSFDRGADRDSLNTSQNMMDLLYHIGGEQARREYYIHRGVQCNSCAAIPIQGIRYHCVNCFDYDLCEACEAGQVHIKTHVFLKIRIPGPTRGSVKDVTVPWYPGKPEMTRETLPHLVSRRLLKNTKIDKTELDALYDQFRTLAGAPFESDTLGIGMAINRAGFDQYFAVSNKSRHSPPLLMYDRIFAFYDTNNDGLIDFEEFIKGLINLQDDSRDAKLRRIFRGYDLDDDGYVERKDFLRMFRSYYAYMKEINRELVAHLEEENTAEGLRELLESSQPISAAFTGAIPHGHTSRAGAGKEPGANGDFVIQDEYGALEEDFDAHGDRNAVIAAAAVGSRASLSNGHSFPTFVTEPAQDTSTVRHREPEFELATTMLAVNDEELGGNPSDRVGVIHDHADRLDTGYDRDRQERINKALKERWRRREFYTDQEEGMSKPPGYTEDDSSDEDDGIEPTESATNSAFVSRRPSLRSRSSSKVRFEDSLTDTDFETRSNTSSRSIPVNERWGGVELSEAEREIGKEILYQTVQQSYNELLDILFKDKEEMSLLARQSRAERETRADEIQAYKEKQDAKTYREQKALLAADMLRTEELFAIAVNGDARQAPSMAIDPETASISSYNAQIESAEDGSSLGHATGPESRRDPTLPQFRPDHATPPTSPKANPMKPAPKPRQPLSKSTLARYVLHELYEVEAKERGGPGKISFDEFAAKMIKDQGDDVEKALGRIEKDEDREGKWPKTAELGKLEVVGIWLDWASF